jgi:hypothetical protein
MKQLITLLTLSCILFSCKKSSGEEEYYTLSGIVLDFDSYAPIAGAKVYVKQYGYMQPVVDSAISDGNGRVSFNLKKEGAFKFLSPLKAGYLNPINWIGYYANYNDRTDDLYLARPSFINVTTHKAGTYLPSDTIDVQVMNDNVPPIGQYNTFRPIFRDKADVADRTFNLQAAYGHARGDLFYGAVKLYFRSEIIRGGSVLSTKTDSTNIIQFGTQNFTLNY